MIHWVIILCQALYIFSFNYHNTPWHGSHHPHFTNEDIKLEKLGTPGHSGERSGQKWRVTAGRFGGSFSDGENFLNLDCSGIWTTL